MSRFYIFTALLASVVMVSACATSHRGKHSGHAGPTRILYSPNGEPLNGGPLGKPTCQEAITRWFDRLNTNHANGISQDEFLADARIQFQRMDIHGKGYLVPEELERFRQPYRQSPSSFSPAETSSAASGEDQASQPSYGSHRHRHGGMGGSGNSGNVTADSSKSQGYGAVVDPVMSADTDLDNRVTPAEFMIYAQKTFATLDSDHNNVLSRAEVLSLCGENEKK